MIRIVLFICYFNIRLRGTFHKLNIHTSSLFYVHFSIIFYHNQTLLPCCDCRILCVIKEYELILSVIVAKACFETTAFFFRLL